MEIIPNTIGEYIKYLPTAITIIIAIIGLKTLRYLKNHNVI